MRANHRHFDPSSVSTVPDLFTPPAQDVNTSWEAAGKIAPHVPGIREAVYRYVAGRGDFGATAREICHGLTISPDTCRPRLIELQGTASWAHGKLPARILRTSGKREGMRIYVAIR